MVPGKVAWVLQELPNLVAAGVAIAFADERALASTANRILLALFVTHYVQRTLIFPFLIRGGKPSAFMPFAMAFAFCCVNGYVQCRTLTALRVYEEQWARSPQFIAGVALWAAGLAANIHSDAILRGLRRPGETGYKIPRGGLFELVSGANFFGEMVEWTGFAIAAGSLPAVCFAVTTALNIGPRAVQHHRWYLKKFKGEYPAGRRALIPWVL